MSGPCYTCGEMISKTKWHCAHVKAQVKGGTEIIQNLRTCCQQCNLRMGNQNLYAFIRDKDLPGPGAENVKSYMARHKSERRSQRTNNFGRS